MNRAVVSSIVLMLSMPTVTGRTVGVQQDNETGCSANSMLVHCAATQSLYYASGGTLFAIDTSSHRTIWQVRIPDAGRFLVGLAVTSHQVIVSASPGQQYAYSRSAGQLVWQASFLTHDLIGSGEHVLLQSGADAGVIALDEKGHVAWEHHGLPGAGWVNFLAERRGLALTSAYTVSGATGTIGVKVRPGRSGTLGADLSAIVGDETTGEVCSTRNQSQRDWCRDVEQAKCLIGLIGLSNYIVALGRVDRQNFDAGIRFQSLGAQGQIKWVATVDDVYNSIAPGVSRSRGLLIYYGMSSDHRGRLGALDLETGRLVWQVLLLKGFEPRLGYLACNDHECFAPGVLKSSPVLAVVNAATGSSTSVIQLGM